MCCFNKPIAHVGATRILVSSTTDGSRQITIYENVVGESEKKHRGTPGMYRDADGKVHAGNPPPELVAQREAEKKALEAENAKNAMILPAPLKAGEKIQVLDLSKDKFSFTRLSKWFPKLVELNQGRGMKYDKSQQTASKSAHLAVQAVGNYFISLAENLDDLDRIDPEVFKVSPNIKDLFSKHYASGFGFVICSFDPNKKIQAHPIGYVHNLMDGGKLFVPTRHQHSEDVKPKEKFDHEIYSINTTNEGGAGMSVEDVERQNADNLKREFSKNLSKPEEMAKVLESEVLSPLYPPIQSLRQRKINGLFANEDFVFVLS
jgi:hypothetical protein